MIKLLLQNKFKSLEPFQIELPDFVILTGLNGVGKTQILQGIQNNLIFLTDETGNNLDPKKYVTSNNLAPNNSTVVTRDQLLQVPRGLWDEFSNQYLNSKQRNPDLNFDNVFNPKSEHSYTITKISEYADKEIDDLTAEDFYHFFPIEDGFKNIDVFQQNFSNLFKRYQDKFEENEYRRYKNEIRGIKNISFLTNNEFIDTYGEAPWLFVNEIIQEADLDYYLYVPEDYNRDAPFQLKLVNTINKAEINFSDLSSGEKVLMSLALALYNSNFDIQFPKVLLMDEPDASLHPSMSKKFLDVINEVFVKEKGVKVIVTTHSPSTVALAPEESIFVAQKEKNRIKKASKDFALNILTSGLPSLSINYENRRQIFVESENDVKFYEGLYQKLRPFLQKEISLSFISSGESRTDKNGAKISNCDQVKNISSTLRKAGNNLVWGIIDWDTKNKSTENYLKVLGSDSRYSIENYLFDPILLTALLLREKIILREDLGLIDNQNYTDFKDLTEVHLQRVSDFLIDSISEEFNFKNKEFRECKFINKKKINIPIWYLETNGHILEEKILKVFPQLNNLKRGKEEMLKMEIIDKVIDDIPNLISNDLLELFKSIQQ